MTLYSESETNMVMQTRDTKIDRQGKEWTVPLVAQGQGHTTTTKKSQIMKKMEEREKWKIENEREKKTRRVSYAGL